MAAIFILTTVFFCANGFDVVLVGVVVIAAAAAGAADGCGLLGVELVGDELTSTDEVRLSADAGEVMVTDGLLLVLIASLVLDMSRLFSETVERELLFGDSSFSTIFLRSNFINQLSFPRSVFRII